MDKCCDIIGVLTWVWRGIEEVSTGSNWRTMAEESSRLPWRCQLGGWHWTAIDHVPIVQGEQAGHAQSLSVRAVWPCSFGDPMGMSLPPSGLCLSCAETVPTAVTSISGMRYFPSLIDRYFCVNNLQHSPQHRKDSDLMEQFQRRPRCSKCCSMSVTETGWERRGSSA